MDNFELVYELNRAVNTLNNYIDATIARKSGLTRAQCVALLLIVRFPGLTRADLARKLNCSHVAVGRLAAILVREGYVSYTPDKQNEHMLHLRATPAGEVMIQQVQEVFQQQSAPLFARVQAACDIESLTLQLHTFAETLVASKEAHGREQA